MSRLPPVAGALLLLAQAAILVAQSPDPRVGADSRRAIIFIIDDLNIEFRDTIRVRALVRSLGHRLVRDGDLYGIVSTGESSIDLDLTSNPVLMDPAVMRIVGNGLKPQEMMQPDAVDQIARREQLAFSTMRNQLARLESTQSSRKVVFLISNGWDLDRSVESINELDEVAREGTRRMVAFCTIDPRGLGSGSRGRIWSIPTSGRLIYRGSKTICGPWRRTLVAYPLPTPPISMERWNGYSQSPRHEDEQRPHTGPSPVTPVPGASRVRT